MNQNYRANGIYTVRESVVRYKGAGKETSAAWVLIFSVDMFGITLYPEQLELPSFALHVGKHHDAAESGFPCLCWCKSHTYRVIEAASTFVVSRKQQ